MSEPFDPDAYLKARRASFDPDAYLKQRRGDENDARAGVRGFLQGVTFGHADEIAAGGEALVDALTTDKKLVDAYRERRDMYRGIYDTERAQSPKSFLAGEVAGGVAAPVPGGTAAKGASLLSRAGQMAKTGAKVGALYGLGTSDADLTRGEVVEAVKDALSTAAVAAPVAGAVPIIGAGANAVFKGMVKPTPAAKLLRSKGVDLTVGQQNPASVLGQLEQANTSSTGFGSLIQGQRQAGREAWQRAVVNESRPPGVAGKLQGELADQVGQVADEFGQAYGVLKGHRLEPEMYIGKGKWRGLITDESLKGAAKTKGIFDLAVDNPNIVATKESRELIRNYLRGQLSQLPKGASKNGMPADRAQALRSDIRTKIRDLLGGNPGSQERAQAEMLKAAEEGLTEIMEAQLPDDVSKALRATDAKYGAKRTLERAVASSADNPAGFTPHQLSQAVRQGSNTGAYARGGGGSLRALARAGRETLDTTVPPTGARLLMVPLSNVPVLNMLPGALSYAANRPSIKPFVLGETALQRGSQSLSKAIDTSPVGKLLRAGKGGPVGGSSRLFGHSNPPPQMTPQLTDEEEEEIQRRLAVIQALTQR